MFVYIFPYIGQLTDRYHSGGGLVVSAKGGIDRVLELIEANNKLSADEYMGTYGDADLDYDNLPKFIAPTAQELESAAVFEVSGDAPEAVYVFPNAGCC